MTYYGQILIKKLQAGVKMTEAFHSHLDLMLFRSFYKNMTWISFAVLIRYVSPQSLIPLGPVVQSFVTANPGLMFIPLFKFLYVYILVCSFQKLRNQNYY